jgi:GSH-dependent disulfide-bond oxidoreductase
MQTHATPPIDVYLAEPADALPVTLLLEECHLPYRLLPLVGDHAAPLPPGLPMLPPAALAVAVVDHDTGVHVFRPGASLLYLAEKTGRFLPVDPDGRFAVLQWLFWQIEAGVAGVDGLAVLEAVLARQPHLAGDYSIADMAAWAALQRWQHVEPALEPPHHVLRWANAIAHRPAARRAASATGPGPSSP